MAAQKRLLKEITDMRNNSPTWCTVDLVDENIQKWKATVQGPEGSPYEKGSFHIDIDVPADYPFKPPTIKFKTKIYHPNIKSSDGSICAEVFSTWSPQLKILDVLTTIRSILIDPNPDSPLEADIAQQFKTDRNAFNKTAKEQTKKWAR